MRKLIRLLYRFWAYFIWLTSGRHYLPYPNDYETWEELNYRKELDETLMGCSYIWVRRKGSRIIEIHRIDPLTVQETAEGVQIRTPEGIVFLPNQDIEKISLNARSE